MNNLISVIVPAYNVAPWLPRCLESILEQTYKNLQIIVVDDGSTDNTAEIIKMYTAKYPDVIQAVYLKNGGVTNARLQGVKVAKGEWIGFVDGDDVIETDMYEFLLENALKYNVSIAHCGYQMMFPDGRVNYFHNTGCIIEQDGKKGLIDLLEGTIVEPGLWNKLFRKDLFEDLLNGNDFIDLSIRINEDLLMNFMLFGHSKCSIYIDQCKYHYIVRDESATRKPINFHKIYDPIRVKSRILELAPRDVAVPASKAYLDTCINVYNTLLLNGNQKYQTDISKIRSFIIEKKEWIRLLNRKRRALAFLIIKVPCFYKYVYKIYDRFFSENPYE